MNNKPKNGGTKGSPYKHEQIRLDHRHRPDEGDIYERYSAPYHNDELHDRYERRQERHREFRERRSPDERYDKIGNPSGMHVARIEIANEAEDRWDHRKAEQNTSKTRNQANTERRGSAPPSSKPTQSASKIPPPPPCMKSFEVIDGYRSSLNHNGANQQRQSELQKENAPKRRARDESQHNVDPPVERPRYPNTKASVGPNERRSPSRERSNKMAAVNMANAQNGPAQRPTDLRVPAQRSTDLRAPTQRTVPTNQFLNVPERKHQNGRATPQQIKNVQEVVQKMNSGEWPTKINQEIVEVKIEVPPMQKNRAQLVEAVEKAKNWETLPRSRNSPEDQRREANDRELPQNLHKERMRKMEEKKLEKRRRHKDDDDSSDRSDIGELTTVSTDSAFGSEAFPLHSYQIGSQLALQHQQNVREMEFEAEKLLLYFKGHRVLLNYLGIGLTETLWRRMTPLPLCEMEIRPVEVTRQYSEHIDTEAKVVMVQVPKNDVDRQRSSINIGEQMERSLPAQSPRLMALERQLRTDDLNYDWEESSRGYSSDGEGERRDSRRMDSRSGRFVKKSAAALIAKKQGFSSQHCLEQPSSSEIVDPRIASEIRALREREEEFRRSRTELGLPTLDDVMNRTFMGHHGGLRTAHSYDQLHQLVNDHYAHEQEQLFHASQKESQRKKRKSQEAHSRQRSSEERGYVDRTSSRAVNQVDL